MTSKKIAKLALEDGTIFTGVSFGAEGTKQAEVVFNTSMTGYQEILTDPSYSEQIVTMTYPMIGNYGVCSEDTESRKIHVSGFIVREPATVVSNHRSTSSLEEYLKTNGIVGISDIDTRALTRKLRIKGAMRGVISTEVLDNKELVDMARSYAGLVGRDIVKDVCRGEKCDWHEGYNSEFSGPHAEKHSKKYNIVAFDCGLKDNISRNLIEAGFNVTIMPASASFDEIMAVRPDGIFVSNGPGDPEPIKYTIETIKKLIDKHIPMFGICLGLQLIGQALGGKTYKLKFGHRGGNQPVKNLDTGRVEITSQNHGFAIDIDSLNKNDIRVTHINLNDNTLEGFAHNHLPLFAVQYHPEASPGPHDANYLFHEFYKMVKSGKALKKIGE
ncbi:MAG: glutamine-hydrolyzing carbamoyl-phosphate synthase small subunit [Sedimentisphaerales bacterium]|nr:glutamine-hydrolyzing carbamoyl-phosphate synthase small subunit [Sedimentisphaerales bacterium]MBN2844270.1 glutamine-hydrolyzing carbamoyl-phosphate synthase small subunit [Sedimentisphaerales bacterium]